MEIKPIPPRAWQYSDGFFETLLWHQNRLVWETWHEQRVKKTAALLKFQLPTDTFPLSKLIGFFMREQKLQIQENQSFRIRLHFARQGQGLYSPQTLEAHCCACEIQSLDPKKLYQNQGLNIGLYRAHRRPNRQILGNYKLSANSLIPVLASIEKQNQGWDEALLLNQENRISEAIASNVWVYFSNKKLVLSPPLSEGCLDGVLRRVLIENQILANCGLEVQEQPIKLSELKQASEIWLSNSILGLRYVQTFGSWQGQNQMATKISTALQSYLSPPRKG